MRDKVCTIILSELKDEFNHRDARRDEILIKELKNSLLVKDEEIMLRCLKKLLEDKDDKR